MEDIEKGLRLFVIHNLQGLLALHEMERVRWNRVILAPETTPEQREAAIIYRDEAFAAWGRTLMELEEMRSLVNSI
jgi:hypothetical protein